MNLRTLAACSLMMLPGFALAGTVSGEASLGYLSSSGNTKTSTGTAKLAVDYTETQWKNAFTAAAYTASDKGANTAERYLLTDKLDWKLSEVDYVFGVLEFEKDLFGGIRERYSETAGYGRHILTGPVHLLDAEVGAGARQTKEQNTGIKENDLILRGYGKYQWVISETSQFAQTLKVESGQSNTYTESVSELKMSIVGNLFAALSYTIKNNSDVPVGTKSTDTFTSISAVYTFGK